MTAFATITDADWQREIKARRAGGPFHATPLSLRIRRRAAKQFPELTAGSIHAERAKLGDRQHAPGAQAVLEPCVGGYPAHSKLGNASHV